MIKFNKDKFEVFMGWLIVLIVIINIPISNIKTLILIEKMAKINKKLVNTCL